MSKRREKLYLADIMDSIEAIESYVQGFTFNDFQDDRKTYSAVIREFEIIGEAVKHLSTQTLALYDDIEWRDIQDFRNILIHEYFGVDLEMVWNVIIDDLPKLKSAVSEMLHSDRGQKE